MFTYIYDGFVTHRKHERQMSQIETRLTDLGISGRIERLTMFKNIREIIADAERRGCETVVAVGNDETVGKIVEVAGDFDMAFGIIPVGEGPHVIADMLGIPADVEACNSISRRVLKKIDLGRINGRFFLSSIKIPRTRAKISCNGQYNVIPTEDNEVEICNLATLAVSEGGHRTVSSPSDGQFEAVFRPSAPRGLFSRLWRSPMHNEKPTVVPAKYLTLTHKTPITAMRDGQRFSSTSFKVEIIPEKLKVITGKDRKFQ